MPTPKPVKKTDRARRRGTLAKSLHCWTHRTIVCESRGPWKHWENTSVCQGEEHTGQFRRRKHTVMSGVTSGGDGKESRKNRARISQGQDVEQRDQGNATKNFPVEPETKKKV